MDEHSTAAEEAMHSKLCFLDDFLESIPQRSENDSSSSSSSSGDLTGIHSKLISSAFLTIEATDTFSYGDVILQFWKPTTIDGRRVLSTNGQPFKPFMLTKFNEYRRRSVEYAYNIDVNYKQLDINEQVNPMIINGAPAARSFLNRFPVFVDNDEGSPLTDYASECDLYYSFMLPVCWPSQNSSCCIGVVECSISIPSSTVFVFVNKALQEVGLSIFLVQERIPYQIIGGLKPMRDQIEEALKIVCESNNIPLAQVWIPFENDSQTKEKFTIKLTGYCANKDYLADEEFDSDDIESSCDKYYGLCDTFPLEMGVNFVEKTLEDYKPRFCNDNFNLSDDALKEFFFVRISRLAICLNSILTGDFCYAFEFEFIWDEDPDSDVRFVEELLLKLKERLPSFKLASGAELGDELDCIKVEDSTATETKFLKIFQGKRLSPIPEVLGEGRRIPVPMVVEYIAPLEAKYKTTPIPLSRQVIEQQFVNTETEAAENLKGKKAMVENRIAPLETKYKTAPILLSQEAIEHHYGTFMKEVAKTLNEPGDESDVENSTRSEKILQENIPDPLERGKKPIVENYIAPSARKPKTARIDLSLEAIEHQYGNTQKEAAKNLNVSLSTLKRKCKDFCISEWQGPSPAKRKVNNSSNQSAKNEEYDGAVQDPSAINKNENTLTIKAEYADDMIKFHLCISEATFITVEEEIGKKFKLTHGTYKLKYLDEDKDWILLASDQDMSDCMKSSRNLGRIVVRLHVLPSTQPISG